MTLISFIRLLLRFKWPIMLAPILTAGIIYLMLTGKPDSFESKSVVYTGLVSGFNLESGSGSRLDYHVVSSGFDNLINTIKARETLLDASIELMSRITCAGSYPLLENESWRTELIEHVGNLTSESGCNSHRDVIRTEAYVVDSYVYYLLFRSATPLSLNALLSNLSVHRVSSSDLMELSFTASDPQLAQDMLTVLNASFINRYQKIKRREVGSVVEFFEAETARSFDRLQLAVNRTREFGTNNRVINFYEQTKAIASQKELIDQQIRQEEMNLEAAESAERDLELRIGNTASIRTHGVALMEMRQRFAELTAEQALKATSEQVTTKTDVLISDVGDEIEQVVEDLYRARYSKEGLVKSELVERWLDEMVNIAQSKASLEVLRVRKAEYIQVYDQFAPMGSTLNSLEREVDIAEGEYLELLHSLNQARMRQQNIELSSSMDVLDKPNYPHEPVPSKMLMLLMAGCLASAFLSIGLAVLTELTDQSLRSPEEARAKTGMDLVGFLPDEDESMGPQEMMSNRRSCLEQLSAKLLTLVSLGTDADVATIFVGSTSEGSGKTHVIERLAEHLREKGVSVDCCLPRHQKPIITSSLPGSVNSGESKNAPGLDDDNAEGRGVKQIILKEIPAFTRSDLPVDELLEATCVLWVARADLLWSSLEADAIDFIRHHVKLTPLLCLNKVKAERMEAALGGTIKYRSRPRKTAKKVLQRNFS